jgi:hypothetical protein
MESLTPAVKSTGMMQGAEEGRCSGDGVRGLLQGVLEIRNAPCIRVNMYAFMLSFALTYNIHKNASMQLAIQHCHPCLSFPVVIIHVHWLDARLFPCLTPIIRATAEISVLADLPIQSGKLHACYVPPCVFNIIKADSAKRIIHL